jgi:hypothetical protein
LLERGVERLGGEHGRVVALGWKAAEAGYYVGGRNAGRLMERLSLDEFGEQRAAGDGRGASLGFEADVGDPRAVNADWRERRRMSPQAGLETSTVMAGEGSSPALRGLWK